MRKVLTKTCQQEDDLIIQYYFAHEEMGGGGREAVSFHRLSQVRETTGEQIMA